MLGQVGTFLQKRGYKIKDVYKRQELTYLLPAIGLAFFISHQGGLQMADDKKNIPEAAPLAEAPAPAVDNAVVPEQPTPEPALTDAEADVYKRQA